MLKRICHRICHRDYNIWLVVTLVAMVIITLPGATTMAWSNNVRKTSGVALEKIDEYSSVARDQRGEVTVSIPE